jgi:hypothetical protein
MPFAGMSEADRLKHEDELRKKMEETAAHLRDLILAQPPRDLISYLWHGLLRHQSGEPKKKGKKESAKESAILPIELEQAQFLLEYVHATLATTNTEEPKSLNEAQMKELVKVGQSLWMLSMQYCMISSAGTEGGPFGDKTADVEFRAKSNWCMIRGHRYQTLEGEFYGAALAPHDAALKEVYGIGAGEIAVEIQKISDSMRLGHMYAYQAMANFMKGVAKIAEEKGCGPEDAMKFWLEANPNGKNKAGDIFHELFHADTGNLSKHTKLPAALLEDLAYERGGNTDFFAAGALAGTPLRSLPARIKPLIKLGTDYLAVDPTFVRDVSYRAILFHLLRRNPAYKQEFEARQKEFSETAFTNILAEQTHGAKVFREVYYKDPQTGEWVENDTLILLGDVLTLVEAKAGANATIASPALDFARHVRDVKELVTNAYAQCNRFFKYLASQTEVPIYQLQSGKHVEVTKIRMSDYRLMVPIGLTVESFSPFSAMCKSLPDIKPILGKYPFISISIDDSLVLNRSLPTAGEFFHYLSVRQAVAGIEEAHLYDEMDHVGSYISKNRFDMDLREQLEGKEATLLMWDGFCKPVDEYFGSLDWEKEPPPSQKRHPEVDKLLGALRETNEAGWLEADHRIRDLSGDAQDNLGDMLGKLRETLSKHSYRWFLIGEDPLFFWVQRVGVIADFGTIKAKAKAAAISVKASKIVAVLMFAEADGSITRATQVPVEVPGEGAPEYAALQTDAAAMADRQFNLPAKKKEPPKKLPRQNQPCWCGSERKYKNCHGKSWGKH